jgi:hypothetical protein
VSGIPAARCAAPPPRPARGPTPHATAAGAGGGAGLGAGGGEHGAPCHDGEGLDFGALTAAGAAATLPVVRLGRVGSKDAKEPGSHRERGMGVRGRRDEETGIEHSRLAPLLSLVGSMSSAPRLILEPRASLLVSPPCKLSSASLKALICFMLYVHSRFQRPHGSASKNTHESVLGR